MAQRSPWQRCAKYIVSFAASDRDAFFQSVAHRIRAVATGGMLGLSRELMDRMPALEIIAVNGIGTDAVDLDEARGEACG